MTACPIYSRTQATTRLQMTDKDYAPFASESEREIFALSVQATALIGMRDAIDRKLADMEIQVAELLQSQPAIKQ